MDSEVEILKSKILSTEKVTPEVIDDLNHLTLLQMKSEPAVAYETAKRTIMEAQQITYHRGEAMALVHAGTYASQQRDYHQARIFFRQALLLREKMADAEGIAMVLAKIGTANLHDGKYIEALEFYHRAIDIRLSLKDELGAADLYSNSGIIYGFQGNYMLSLKSHLAALKTYEKLQETSRIASSSLNLGLIYSEQKNYEEALEMYKRALAIRQQAHDTTATSDLLNNIGNVFYDQKKYTEAIEKHQEALQLRELTGDKLKIATSYVNLGQVYKETGEHEKALEYYNRSLLLFQQVNEKRRLVQLYCHMGELFLLLRDNIKAKQYLNEAVKLAEETGLKNHLLIALEHLSKLLAQEEKFEEAYKLHLRFTQLDKEISNTETSKQIAQMNVRYEMEQKEREAELEREKHAELTKAYNSLEEEKKRSEELLLNILPLEVSEELKQFGKTKARSFESVTVMFADIKGFTLISEQLSAEEIVSGIDEYFEAFDKIIENHGIEKIKTIGDAYLCASGVPLKVENHADNIIYTAQEFVAVVKMLKEKRISEGKAVFEFRIGIHSGPLVAGVVGSKKFAYDIWGDTVNTAARMEANSEPNRINISESTYQLVRDKFDCTYRGEIEAKNKGKLKMYFVE